MVLTREEMLDRAMASDGEFDRIFITGVLSTGIYCLPSCRARKPKPENIRFFQTAEEAKAAGLRPCKKCRPDDFLLGVNADLERIEAVVNRLQVHPGAFAGIESLGEAAGIGASTLYTGIRRHYHTTPGDLIARSRVDAACRRLLETSAGVADIAFEVGFETLSTFYDHFGKRTGMAPNAYRALPETSRFHVGLPGDFQTGAALGYFGRDVASISERIGENELWLAVNLGGRPAALHLAFGEARVACSVSGAGAVDAHRAVVRMVGLRQDPKGFEQHAAKLGHERLVAGRGGLRVPMTASAYDGLVWCIVGQQVNLPFAYALRRRLTENFGTPVAYGLIAPPQAHQVAALSVEKLLPLQFSRRKAEYLIDISRHVAEGNLKWDELEAGSATRAEQTLLALRGLGPWSANYLMMRALGFADCLPLGDTGITSALQRYFHLDVRPDATKTRELMAPFSPYRSLATIHLWQSLHFES